MLLGSNAGFTQVPGEILVSEWKRLSVSGHYPNLPGRFEQDRLMQFCGETDDQYMLIAGHQKKPTTHQPKGNLSDDPRPTTVTAPANVDVPC